MPNPPGLDKLEEGLTHARDWLARSEVGSQGRGGRVSEHASYAAISSQRMLLHFSWIGAQCNATP